MIPGDLNKAAFKSGILKRYFLRFHLSFILIATFCTGLLTTKLLLSININNVLIRFPVVVIISYAAFFGFVKLWLLYISHSEKKGSASDFVDLIPTPGSPSGGSSEVIRGGGGRFGGGGAGGSFNQQLSPDLQANSTGVLDIGSPAGVHDSIIETTSHSVGDAVSIVGDVASSGIDSVSSVAEGLSAGLVLFILGIIIVVVTGAGAFIIFEGQEILIEAAFNFLLSTSLLRGLRNIDAPHWAGSIIRATYIPGLVVLGSSFIIAIIVTSLCPQATKLSEFIRYLLAR